MNYKTPQYISLALSAIGASLLFFEHHILAQTSLTLAFLVGFGAFKKKGSGFVATIAMVPCILISYYYFDSKAFPFMSLGILIGAAQNPVLDVLMPSKMYNDLRLKYVTSITSVTFYLIANISFYKSWDSWMFPGIILLLSNFMIVIHIPELRNIRAASGKGYIKPGSHCPDFNLPDENGNNISLNDFTGKFVLMIFVRGDWCPGCHIMLRTYQRFKEKFAERNVQLLSIGPDPFGINKEMVEKLGLNFHVLSDEKQSLARQFCVELVASVPGAPKYDFIPLPASFLVDKQGVVRYTSRADKAGEILNPAQIFEVLDSLK